MKSNLAQLILEVEKKSEKNTVSEADLAPLLLQITELEIPLYDEIHIPLEALVVHSKVIARIAALNCLSAYAPKQQTEAGLQVLVRINDDLTLALMAYFAKQVLLIEQAERLAASSEPVWKVLEEPTKSPPNQDPPAEQPGELPSGV